MFEQIYELAAKLEQGDPNDLDERARQCRKTQESVTDVGIKLGNTKTTLGDTWHSGAGDMACADLSAFQDNRAQQAEDLNTSAQSFEKVRDALVEAQRKARNIRDEAKDLEAKLDTTWHAAAKNPLTIPGAWAEQAKTKLKSIELLAEMKWIVLTYDLVLSDEGATIRDMKGQIDEDAGADARAARDREAGDISYLHHILTIAGGDPKRAISLLADKFMDNTSAAAAVYKFLGFKHIPGGDFYTTGEHSIQRLLGWSDFYDGVGKKFGLKLDSTNKPNIEYTDPTTHKQYRLEAWKGDYVGGFGGEVGFYTRDYATGGEVRADAADLGSDLRSGNLAGLGNGIKALAHDTGSWAAGAVTPKDHFNAASGDDQIKVTQQIYNKKTGQVYFTNDGQGADGTDKRHYWNLAIRTDSTVDSSQLGQRATLDFPPGKENVRDGILKSMQEYHNAHHDFRVYENKDGTISYDWKK